MRSIRRRKKLRGGIASNLDVDLTPQQRLVAARDERNAERVRDHLAKSREYQFQGMSGGPVELGADRALISVSHAQERDRQGFTRGERPVVIPIATIYSDNYPKGFDYVLTEADNEAVRAGYLCENCLCWHRIPNLPKCEVCNFRRRMV